MNVPKRVLAIRLDTVGDVVMTTPALGAMVDAGSEVTLLTSTFGGALEPMLPYLSSVVTLDVPWMKHAERHGATPAAQMRMVEWLRAQHFDLAVVFTVSTQNPACAAYLAHLSGIGRVASHVQGKLYGLVTDPVDDLDAAGDSRHEVVRQLDLVHALGYQSHRSALRLDVPRPPKVVCAVLDQVAEGPWCLIHPGATAQSRRYPLQQWVRVIDLLEESGLRVVLAGGRSDRSRCAELSRRVRRRPIRTDGHLTLQEFTALVKAAPVAITCNSAASHLAAAAGTPQVTLYAGTNPQHAPWSECATVLRHHTPCAWCLSSTCPHGTPICTASIAPTSVVDAALDRLMAAAAVPLQPAATATKSQESSDIAVLRAR